MNVIFLHGTSISVARLAFWNSPVTGKVADCNADLRDRALHFSGLLHGGVTISLVASHTAPICVPIWTRLDQYAPPWTHMNPYGLIWILRTLRNPMDSMDSYSYLDSHPYSDSHSYDDSSFDSHPDLYSDSSCSSH